MGSQLPLFTVLDHLITMKSSRPLLSFSREVAYRGKFLWCGAFG